jgi:hypothetical protein
MCPAFGSLRVGLRMRRTATILSGSACCVYGLTFTSHFYGARRSVGYVPFNSETLVTGKLFEDIREAVYAQADPAQLRRHRHHQPVRAHGQRRAAAAAAEGDQRRAHHRHRRAGLRRAHARRGQGRAGRRDAEVRPRPRPSRPGGGAAQRPSATSPPSRCWARCSRPTRWASACCWSRWAWPPARWCRRANGASCMPRSTVRRRRDPPVLHRQRARVRGRGPRHRRLGAGRPRRHRSLAAGHRPPPTCRRRRSTPPRTSGCRHRARWRAPDQGPHHAVAATKVPNCWWPACWSKAAPTCATSAPPARARPGARRPRVAASARRARAVPRLARAGPGRVHEFKPDLAIGTTPVVQAAKQASHPGAVLHQPDLRRAR